MSIQVSAAPWLLAEGWSEGQDLLQLSYFTPPCQQNLAGDSSPAAVRAAVCGLQQILPVG